MRKVTSEERARGWKPKLRCPLCGSDRVEYGLARLTIGYSRCTDCGHSSPIVSLMIEGDTKDSATAGLAILGMFLLGLIAFGALLGSSANKRE